jgi:hypothetical protein
MDILERLVAHLRTERAWRVAFVSVFVLEAIVLLSGLGRQWYYFDEWRLVVERVAPPTHGVREWFHQLFRPDSEHVIAVPLMIFIPLAKWFGADTYAPFVVVNLVVRLLTMWLVSDIARRAGARRSTRLAAVLLVALFGSGYESLFGQSLIFAGLTLVFGLAAIRAVTGPDVPDVRVGLIAGGWLTLAVFCSSYAFPVVVGVALGCAVRRAGRAAGLAFAVPILVFVSVRALEGSPYAPQEPFGLDRVPVTIDYVSAGLTAVGEGITGLRGIGITAFVAIVVMLVFASRTSAQWALSACAAGGAVLFFAQASLSRSVFGPDQAASSRYVFFCAIPLLAAIVAAWGDRRFTARLAGAVSIVFLLSLSTNVARAIDGRTFYLSGMEESRQRLMIGLVAVERGATDFFPDPEHAIDLREDRIPVFLAWDGAETFLDESRACYERWAGDLAGWGLDTEGIDPVDEAALLVLVNEYSLGYGPESTLSDLVLFAVSRAESQQVVDQFLPRYTPLLDRITPESGIVPRRSC